MDYSCKSMRSVAVVMMLMLVCAGCASASYKHCYSNCYADCVAEPRAVEYCIGKCVFKCIGKQQPHIPTNSCNYNCAVHQCPRFGNDADKVEECINKCASQKCD